MLLRRLKAFDWISIAAGVVLVIFSIRMAYGDAAAGRFVSIDSPQGEWRYSLEVDRIIDDLGPSGICVVAIKDSAVFVTESDCPEKICISMGRIESAKEWIACVPHRVFITIEGKIQVQVDEISY